MTCSVPCGNGGFNGFLFTKWFARTGISALRPGRASSAVGICILCGEKKNMIQNPVPAWLIALYIGDPSRLRQDVD